LASIGTASAKDPVTLTDGQLDNVTAGVANVQLPFNTAAFLDGSNGPGTVNQFSPSTATLTQINIRTAINLFTTH
jgi:hypothetical protein